ncbi:TPR domain protein component of TonB system (fragment) [Hyella patelloides LEGE 07179]|uniref:TPR domain protein component of TonB system n=1 Tax=Hyella patelloides LEGE 07179 TaxID=945734 RepID=A0A563W462_9CYAN
MSNPNPSLKIQVSHSRNFLSWLSDQQISLALTTYQSSRLMLVGVNPQGQFSGFERIFDRAMGLYVTPDSQRLYLASRYQLWQLNNVLSPGQLHNHYDKLYVPRIGYTTGDLDLHDLAVDSQGRIIFVSTVLNCLATVSHQHSCLPLWKPSFISKVINEDRCHLNGLAMVEGKPAYVTACSQSDVVGGWREKRKTGGCVIDVASNEVIATGLSMPHSPRWYRDRLWLLNSGTGELGYLDRNKGEFQPVTFCPGYVRGLSFSGNYAIVGLSQPRDETFMGLELQTRLAEKEVSPRCGVMAIDLSTGAVVEWLNFTGEVRELYDIQVLPGVQQATALGFQSDEISRFLTLEAMAD